MEALCDGSARGTKLDRAVLHAMWEGINESRSGSEDCARVGGIAFFGVSLSLVCATKPCVVDDVQHLCHARRFLLLAIRNPWASRSLIAFTAWSSFAHAAVMGTQALRNMVSRGELVGVAILVVIGVALLALAPAKQRRAPGLKPK